MTPLFVAIDAGQAATVRELLEQGANPNESVGVPDPRVPYLDIELNSLEWLSLKGAKLDARIAGDILSLLLDAGADPKIGSPIAYLTSAALLASLIEGGANINARSATRDARAAGATALMSACERQDLGFAEALIAAGADGAMKDVNGSTALVYAVRGPQTSDVITQDQVESRLQMIDLLSLSAAPASAYSQAMGAIGELSILTTRTIVDPGPPVKETTLYGRVDVSLVPILEKLEYYGGNPADFVESDLRGQRRRILMIMLQSPGFRYETFFEFGWLMNRFGFLLLEQQDAAGKSVLHYLFHQSTRMQGGWPIPDTIRLLRLFLTAGADPNAPDYDGATCLHALVGMACRGRNTFDPNPFPCDRGAGQPGCRQCVDAVRELVAAGVDLARRNYSGETAYALSLKKPSCPLQQQLRPRGAFVSSEGTFVYEASQEVWANFRGIDEVAANLAPLVVWTENGTPDFENKNTESSVDPESSRLHSEAQVLYANANDEYLAMEGHVDRFIVINPGNGRRSTITQALYYERYIYHLQYG